MTPDLLSYADVFEDGHPMIPWIQLSSNHKFSTILAKFWGKDMRAHRMDTDETPANFAFSFDIKPVKASNVWVREDYVLLYDECTAFFANAESFSEPPSVVITGQPGIGKSYWIYYAIRRRLGEMKPFIWYFDQQWYLFVKDGVFLCPNHFSATVFRQVGLWVLADPDDSKEGLPKNLSQPLTTVHTIFTTSPQPERWKELLKTTSSTQLIMNPWSWDEIYRAAIDRGYGDDNIEEARAAFNHFGPTPRFCFNFVQNPFEAIAHEAHVDNELNKLSMSSLKMAAQDWTTLKAGVSHCIFLVRRPTSELPGHYLRDYTIEPITIDVLRSLKYKLMVAQQEQQLDLYQAFATIPQTRQLASLAYEMIGHRRFQYEFKLTLIPMARDRKPKSRHFSWLSQSHKSMGSVGTSPIAFHATDTAQYKWPRPSVIEPSVYYIPESANQMAFDSFIMDDGALYFFQFAIASMHPMREGIMEFLSPQSLQTTFQGKVIRFIFIIPPGNKVECPEASSDRMDEFWKEVDLFSAEFDPKNHVG